MKTDVVGLRIWYRLTKFSESPVIIMSPWTAMEGIYLTPLKIRRTKTYYEISIDRKALTIVLHYIHFCIVQHVVFFL